MLRRSIATQKLGRGHLKKKREWGVTLGEQKQGPARGRREGKPSKKTVRFFKKSLNRGSGVPFEELSNICRRPT